MAIKRIAVLGGGSWATALVKVLLENVEQVCWYMRDAKKIEYIKEHRRNPKYLSSLELDTSRLTMSDDIAQILEACDTALLVLPSFVLKDAMDGLEVDISQKTIISAVKGMIPGDNLIIADYFNKRHNVPHESFVVLSGPSHAEEIAAERLTYITLASENETLAKDVAEIVECHYVIPVVSNDIYGTEYSAVLKNIMALGAGICHGLGYGDNFQAVFTSNAMKEINRFIDAVHPIDRDVNESVYMGDLLVTSYSQFSRNRTFGNMIGKGYSVQAAQLEMNMVAEGYYATKCIMEKNKKYGVDMPITEAVYRILYEGIAPLIEIKLLTKKFK